MFGGGDTQTTQSVFGGGFSFGAPARYFNIAMICSNFCVLLKKIVKKTMDHQEFRSFPNQGVFLPINEF